MFLIKEIKSVFTRVTIHTSYNRHDHINILPYPLTPLGRVHYVLSLHLPLMVELSIP